MALGIQLLERPFAIIHRRLALLELLLLARINAWVGIFLFFFTTRVTAFEPQLFTHWWRDADSQYCGLKVIALKNTKGIINPCACCVIVVTSFTIYLQPSSLRGVCHSMPRWHIFGRCGLSLHWYPLMIEWCVPVYFASHIWNSRAAIFPCLFLASGFLLVVCAFLLSLFNEIVWIILS